MRVSSRLLRALAAFLALPGVVAFAVPLFIALPAWRRHDAPFHVVALAPLFAGVALLCWCVREFYVAGKGTLAPWDPPRHLVVSGPYRVSRNPMYVAVMLILIGWAIGFASWGLVVYLLCVAAAFVLRVRLAEEPWLTRTHHEAWKRYVARTPRWLFRSRRALVLTGIGLFVVVLFTGLVYEAYADAADARAFPPPGTLVDIGHRRLHLLCIGRGEPLVLFEASGWGNATSGARARERISSRTRVCSYDRRGTGWSDPGPSVASFPDLARDLAVLQDREKLPSPMIIVASSIGGMTAEVFARQYPERVAGLVFLDAASSEMLPTVSKWLGPVTIAGCLASTAAHFGVIRLLDPFALHAEQSDEARRSAALAYGARRWDTLCAMARGTWRDPHFLEKVPPLRPDLPIAVLTASSDEQLFPGSAWFGGSVRAERVASHQRLAKHSTAGSWKMVPKSTHLIASSQPDAVSEAVLMMLEQVGRVPLDPASSP